MPISFNCPRCGSRIQVSWLAPGQLAHCRECGERVAVPNESEPPLIRDKPSGWPSSKGLILAGLIPSAMTVLALVLWPLLNLLVALPTPFVANFLVGRIVGRSASRRRFLYGMGVAVAGWITGYFVTSLVYFALVAPHITRLEGEQSDQGFVVFVGTLVFIGLAASPIAGVASAVGHSRAEESPSAGV